MPHRLFNPEVAERVARFIASGADPHGYYVEAERFRSIVKQIPDVSKEVKHQVLSHVEDQLIKGKDFIDSFRLGIELGKLMGKIKDEEGFIKIVMDVKNLDKLPIVQIDQPQFRN